MMLRGSLVFALVAVTSATGNLGNLKNLVKNARRLQGAATMQDCMTACPMPEMSEDDTDFNGLCKAMDCMNKEDKCGGEGGMVEMMATSTDGMLDCLCDPSIIDHMVGMNGADKAGGSCENEEKDADGDSDPCKMTAGSACVTVMAGAINALKGVTACEGMVKTMEKDWTAEEKICVDDLLAAEKILASDAAPAPSEATSADFAPRAAQYSFFVALSFFAAVLR